MYLVPLFCLVSKESSESEGYQSYLKNVSESIQFLYLDSESSDNFSEYIWFLHF